ncbi:baseplate J/gp47 family protein [Sorangium sp. So ce118]
MALPAVGEANYPTPDEILSVMLGSMQIDAARRGLDIDVSPGSDHHVRMKALSKRVSVAIANGKISRDNYNPLTATGDNLLALCALYGITQRPSAKAAGYIAVRVSTGTAPIPAGFRCTSPTGEKYQTTTAANPTSAGNGQPGNRVQIQAVAGGASTNLSAGTKVTWDSASIGNLLKEATVGNDGIADGTDADDEETMRRRLLAKLSRPGIGGNAAQLQEWAEASSSAVQAAYIYAGARGPGSYDICVTAEGGNRALSTTTVSTVASYVAGQMPGHADLNVTTSAPQEVDTVLAMTLALPTSAGGAGGGWRDSTPWPNASSGNVKITAYDSATGIATTDATAANGLAVGSRIGVWDTDEPSGESPQMVEFTVRYAQLNGSSTYDIKVLRDDNNGSDFGFVPTGAYISAGAVHLVSYAETALEKIRELGPGEKTTSVDILPRGRRQPTPEEGTETDLNSRLLTAIQNEHTEIRSLEYAARYDAGTTTTRTSPSVPTTTANAPKILVLNQLAFRKA